MIAPTLLKQFIKIFFNLNFANQYIFSSFSKVNKFSHCYTNGAESYRCKTWLNVPLLIKVHYLFEQSEVTLSLNKK